MTRFRDRDDAGRQLAQLVVARRFSGPVAVLGIPRGGVPVAAHVARALHADLGVAVARKLRAPQQPELAMGAVTANGEGWLNDDLIAQLGVTRETLERERALQVAEAQRREALLIGEHQPAIAGRVVIVVDDGVATGATAVAAVRSVRAGGASYVVLATPVVSIEAGRRLREVADEVIAVREDESFWAIGEFYYDFSAVEDEEVQKLLIAFREERAAAAALAGRPR